MPLKKGARRTGHVNHLDPRGVESAVRRAYCHRTKAAIRGVRDPLNRARLRKNPARINSIGFLRITIPQRPASAVLFPCQHRPKGFRGRRRDDLSRVESAPGPARRWDLEASVAD